MASGILNNTLIVFISTLSSSPEGALSVKKGVSCGSVVTPGTKKDLLGFGGRPSRFPDTGGRLRHLATSDWRFPLCHNENAGRIRGSLGEDIVNHGVQFEIYCVKQFTFARGLGTIAA